MASANEIAEFFELEGVKAVRGRSDSCAIARYLSDASGHQVRAHSVHTSIPECGTYFVNSKAMRDFIELFDKGAFLKLVR
jgi:hypothetical protein